MTYTTNYNLNKPDTTDPIDIGDLNDNADAIDTALAGLQTDVDTLETAVDGKQDAVVYDTITLSTTWTASDEVYSQEVTISSATENSKIDLQPDATVLAQMLTDGCTALWAENDSGTITVYAYGAALTSEATVQYTQTEVTTA